MSLGPRLVVRLHFLWHLNNLSRFVISYANPQMAVTHLVASAFTSYKNKPVLKMTVTPFIGINVFF